MSAKSNRTKGRQGEFAVREIISRCLSIHQDHVLLRAKGANGCDVWCAEDQKCKFPFSVEVKNRQRIPYWEVLEQMTKNTEKGTAPIAVILNEKVGHTAIIPLSVLLSLVEKLNELGVEDLKEVVTVSAKVIEEEFPRIRDARAYIKEEVIEK